MSEDSGSSPLPRRKEGPRRPARPKPARSNSASNGESERRRPVRPSSSLGKGRGLQQGEKTPSARSAPRHSEASTYLPPVVVVPLRLLGDDASSEPQVSVDVQGPQSLLVPESDADRLQSLPFTANEEEDRGVSTRIRSPRPARPAGTVSGGCGTVWLRRDTPPPSVPRKET